MYLQSHNRFYVECRTGVEVVVVVEVVFVEHIEQGVVVAVFFELFPNFARLETAVDVVAVAYCGFKTHAYAWKYQDVERHIPIHLLLLEAVSHAGREFEILASGKVYIEAQPCL